MRQTSLLQLKCFPLRTAAGFCWRHPIRQWISRHGCSLHPKPTGDLLPRPEDGEVGCSSNDHQIFWALQVKESNSPKASVLHQPHSLSRCLPLKCTTLISASIPIMSWDLRCFICSCLKAFLFTFEIDSPSSAPCPHCSSSWTCFTSPTPVMQTTVCLHYWPSHSPACNDSTAKCPPNA